MKWWAEVGVGRKAVIEIVKIKATTIASAGIHLTTHLTHFLSLAITSGEVHDDDDPSRVHRACLDICCKHTFPSVMP